MVSWLVLPYSGPQRNLGKYHAAIPLSNEICVKVFCLLKREGGGDLFNDQLCFCDRRSTWSKNLHVISNICSIWSTCFLLMTRFRVLLSLSKAIIMMMMVVMVMRFYSSSYQFIGRRSRLFSLDQQLPIRPTSKAPASCSRREESIV